MARRSRSRQTPDKEFFECTARAAFSNPFGDEFAKIYPAIESECARRVDRLESSGTADLRRLAGAHREMMRIVFLFDAYQRFRGALDQLVNEQIGAGDSPVEVSFADELLALLRRRGFAAADALRAFAIFFQIRRAHHFISEGLVGGSACMKEFRRHLWNNVFTHDIRCYERWLCDRMEDFSTLLLGETGTGKGAAAAAIGRSSFIPFDEHKRRFAESFMRGFISLNLSQYPESLIESELFGHRKGAFTGAIEAHQGLLARCSPHGAIFLDEIGEVSPRVQIKLLRVLQDRVFSPVGSHETARFRGRVIAATNKPLAELRAPGGFRDDFYYRLCSDAISVPPLRQRFQEDPRELEALLRHILTRISAPALSELLPLVRDQFRQLVAAKYRWPGNVRELEQAVRRFLLTRAYIGDTPAASMDRGSQLCAALAAGTLDADSLLTGYCALLYEQSGNLEDVARRTNLDRRTVKRYLSIPSAAFHRENPVAARRARQRAM